MWMELSHLCGVPQPASRPSCPQSANGLLPSGSRAPLPCNPPHTPSSRAQHAGPAEPAAKNPLHGITLDCSAASAASAASACKSEGCSREPACAGSNMPGSEQSNLYEHGVRIHSLWHTPSHSPGRHAHSSPRARIGQLSPKVPIRAAICLQLHCSAQFGGYPQQQLHSAWKGCLACLALGCTTVTTLLKHPSRADSLAHSLTHSVSMADDADWRSSLTATERYDNIQKLYVRVVVLHEKEMS